jgi:hypothetical protein
MMVTGSGVSAPSVLTLCLVELAVRRAAMTLLTVGKLHKMIPSIEPKADSKPR